MCVSRLNATMTDETAVSDMNASAGTGAPFSCNQNPTSHYAVKDAMFSTNYLTSVPKHGKQKLLCGHILVILRLTNNRAPKSARSRSLHLSTPQPSLPRMASCCTGSFALDELFVMVTAVLRCCANRFRDKDGSRRSNLVHVNQVEAKQRPVEDEECSRALAEHDSGISKSHSSQASRNEETEIELPTAKTPRGV